MRIFLDLMKEFEQGRKVYEFIWHTAWGPTREPYVTFYGPGSVDELRTEFEKYAENRKGMLYWRTLPQIGLEHNDGIQYYFMRCFIAENENMPHICEYPTEVSESHAPAP